jgi:putative transposase
MSRPLRIEFPGAYYHVMNRGLEYRPIFQSDDDRDRKGEK